MAEHWIQKATSKHEGKFSGWAKRHDMSTQEAARKESGAPGVLGKEARLAKTLMGMHHGGHHGKG